jgi:hypothetical protein
MQVVSERVMYEAMRLELKLQRRFQDVGDARNLEHLTRKTAGNKWSQPKEEVLRTANSEGTGVMFLKLL